MSRLKELETKLKKVCADLASLQSKVNAKTFPHYAVVQGEPGWNYEWWTSEQVPDHVDPRTWDGPLNQFGYTKPTDVAPFASGTTSLTNSINDLNTSGAAMRAGFIWTFVRIPDGAWIDDINGNTGELGFVDVGRLCFDMQATPGANTTTNTSGPERTLMDPHGPYVGDWYLVLMAQSDFSAFGGLQFRISEDGGNTWRALLADETSVTLPTVDCVNVPFCDDPPEDYSDKFIEKIVAPKFAGNGEFVDSEIIEAPTE